MLLFVSLPTFAFGGLSPRRAGSSSGLSASEIGPVDAAMSRYADGDDGAFVAVHRALVERLRTFLVRMCRSQALADDLTQETFLRMHRARGSFAPGARVVPWAYAIARNVYIDHTRQRSARREQPSAEDEELGASIAAGPEVDGEQVTMASELAALVERTLAGLSPNQREAFVLIRYEGMSVEEAAAILGITEGAVKLRAFNAYEALRKALGDAAPKKATHASKAAKRAAGGDA